MITPEVNIPADVESIGRIKVVPLILEIICKTTGMGLAAIARVTEEKWVACGVRDEIKLGLVPGGELALDTTICNDIRLSGEAVIIDNVKEDEVYHNHHKLLRYGFQSYISVPVITNEGRFFGTLCAIDPKPRILNNTEIVGMFKTYANLISFYLNVEDRILAGELQLIEDILTIELEALLHAAKMQAQLPSAKINLHFSAIIYQSTCTVQALVANLNASYEASKTG